MKNYHIHLYREMRLTFEGIEADSPEEAALLARSMRASDARSIEECDGENIAALIDVAGDDDYRLSETIDFEGERLRQAAQLLLEALERAIRELKLWQVGNIKDEGSESAIRIGKAAIEQATSAGVAIINLYDLLAERGQIASIWSIDDVLSIRPDLSPEQAWDVLQQAEGNHDANIGINWEVLRFHAENLFGEAGESAEAEGE